MLIQSADAMGLLCKELISAFGVDSARRLLLRFGYANGYDDSLAGAEQFKAKSMAESVELATTIHTIMGIVKVEPIEAIELPGGGLRTEMLWHNSFEAEQWLKHFGRSKWPVCWSTVGYASGSRSAAFGKDFYYKEVMCVAMGDPHCKIEGRDSASWGDELPCFEADFASAELHTGTASELRKEIDRLKKIEREQKTQLLHYSRLLSDRDADSDEIRSRAVDLSNNGRFIVRSMVMSEAIEQAIRVATLNTQVLVQGESGTGKEFVVNLIHQQSLRAREVFVSVNCAALTDTLLESELFGHVRGAFTGAVREKLGLFELASNGTLFLDEIGEMPLSLQSKLLRALENGEIRRVGGDHCIKVHPRILAATNRDLRRDVEAGKFRQDLYYRVAGFIIKLPPLRQRTEEIAPMAHNFMREAAKNLDKQISSIRPEAMTHLVRYPWPGNVRELKHSIERAVIVARGSTIEVDDLPAEVTSWQDNLAGESLDLKRNEKALIQEALQRNHGTRASVAEALNISPVTLWRKMRRYGIDDGELR
jgi:DNA-binding NtrC family response regulator